MKAPFSLLIVGVGLTLAACSKDSNPTPEPGTIIGQISQASAVARIEATNASNQTFTTTPSSSGQYSFEQMEAGAYTVRFWTNSTYVAPAAKSAEVKAGQTTDLGLTTINSSLGATYSLNNTTVKTTAQAALTNNQLTITIPAAGGNIQLVLKPFQFGLQNQAWLLLAPTTPSTVAYATYTQGNLQWTTHATSNSSGGSGGCLVTFATDTGMAKRVVGSFNFDADPQSGGATGTVSIKEGQFDIVF